MKRILNSMALGAIVGATSGLLIDSFNKTQNTKRTIKNVINGAVLGAAAFGGKTTYMVVKDFRDDIKNEVKQEIYEKLEKEVLNNIDYNELKNDMHKIANDKIDNVIEHINKTGNQKIDKAIQEINNQNILELEKATTKKLNDVDNSIQVIFKDIKSIRSMISNNAKYIVGENTTSATNKYDIIQSMVESGEYTSYDIKSIIDKLN